MSGVLTHRFWKESEMETGQINGEELLGFDSIFRADDHSYKVVKVPEWGGPVRLASVSAAILIWWSDSKNDITNNNRGFALLLLSMVDKEGNRLAANPLTHPEQFKEQLERLKSRSSLVLSRLIAECYRLSGMSKVAEEMEKNASSETAPSVSPIVSPSASDAGTLSV
jgi:hypothetical protein